MRPEQVAFLSFEGGGRAGLTIHPGVAQALSDLGVLRYDEAGRQVGVGGFAGSSSGTVVATLLSCGYRYDELFMLLSEPAFDLVFRQEEFRLGQFSKLNGVCTPPDTSKVPPWIYAPSVIDAYDDPIGAVALNSLMHLQSVVEEALNNGVFQDSAFRSGLARRIDAIQLGEGKPQWLQNLVAAATGELGRELTNATVEWVKENRLKKVEHDYPHVAFKLFEHVLNADNRVHKNLDNVFNILKWDFGIFAGCAWRDFLDQIITFARFRVRYFDLLPTLTAPVDINFLGAASVGQVFTDRILAAEAAEAFSAQPESPPDFLALYEGMRNTTFEGHRADFYPGHPPDGPPPLALSGANLATQESHLFSALTTPWLCVADAVRIATGLPPIFKPVVITDKDIPSQWPRITDAFGEEHFMVGYWMDGGVYWNSPFDTFRPWETSSGTTLGIGMGVGKRVVIDDVTDFYLSMINVVHERNISATRADLDRFILLKTHDIAVLGPRMTQAELDFYRGYGWWETFRYFGLVAGEPPQP